MVHRPTSYPGSMVNLILKMVSTALNVTFGLARLESAYSVDERLQKDLGKIKLFNDL